MEQRPQPITARPGAVAQLGPGMAGYRLRLPEKMHPISAGVKGGIVGGLVMPIPALIYGLVSGHGIWFPVNLLAGMVLPMDGENPDKLLENLQAFHLSALVGGMCLHAVISVTLGLFYGVLLPMLPDLPGGKALWGGVLLPLLWTAISYGLMGVVNPTMQQFVAWPYFLVSQLIFGIVASIVVMRTQKIAVEPVRGKTTDQAGRAP